MKFEDYVKHGWVLVSLIPGTKMPARANWNRLESTIRTEEEASILAAAGLCHAYSGTCAIDIDNLAAAKSWFDSHGIDLYELFLASDSVQIVSPNKNRGKLLYKLDKPLKTVYAAEYTTKEGNRAKAVEFRCATAEGHTVCDVLPPSPHPSGGVYSWGSAGNGSWQNLPVLPKKIHDLWLALLSLNKSDQRETEPTINKNLLVAHIKTLDPDMGYNDWLTVGQALHHEYGGSEEGLKIWIEWSRKGRKFSGEHELRYKWNTFVAGKGVTGQTVLGMQNVKPEEFPVVSTTEEPKKFRVEYVTAKDLLKPYDAPPYLVERLLELGCEASLIGPSKSYKSLWALELGARVATGTPFFGYYCTKGLVVYLCGEGANGLRYRLQALKKAREIELDYAPFVAIPKPFALPTPEGVDTVKKVIDSAQNLYQMDLALLIVDTFGRYSPGEEKSAEDLYKFFRAVSLCKGKATSLIIHHTGHNDDSRGRGTSAWEQAVDTEFVVRIKPESEIRVFDNTKQKEGELAPSMAFRLSIRETDCTRDDELISSVVLEPIRTTPMRVKLGQKEQILYNIVFKNSGIDVDALMSVAMSSLVKPLSGKDRRKEHLRRALESLLAKNVLMLKGDKVHRIDDISADFDDLLGA